MFTNWLAPPTTTLPPDTIIEVGPPPFTRYAAHSALVSAHSGYLRAAIRSDRPTVNADTIPIYIPNVTTDQFTPLLTYMYTGFLDLNLENIFGVLLATHILHMPRAIEMCRAFLSATQTEHYFGGLNSISAAGAASGHSVSKVKPELETNKVVRPIASKATGIGLNFIAPPTSHISLPSTHTPFKSLLTVSQSSTVITENVENSSPPPGSSQTVESVHHDSTSSTKQHRPCVTEEESKSPKETNQKRQSKSLKRNASKSESVVTTVVKDSNGGDKGVIIDIASCDGPVRFRRVLNDSYGTNSTSNIISMPDDSKGHPRYMSSSFHQQMVRNINERKHMVSGESYGCGNNKDENSQDNNQSQAGMGGTTITPTVGNEQVYNCVYCKHTFKSQYCYQKHAKRHLIPLSMDTGSNVPVVDNISTDITEKEPAAVRYRKPTQHGSSSTKREVKPLDMNVQYYPCKTCGSKFPSYYFVHKHRKMCHADEEIL
ncbi:uncharacterized protein LOC131691858 [Topomyia yanbarensis]|uniref:uncharacterized protein LOC131691858 n=1 Tax=Topomyia yanbarensis TaxID=2498891 RepID=UPI00273B9496|nr:uncharacterized protein LOC131691858 [Topomyia yanbarensis]XP_058834518.1 uncharacterized protein LOC131691858 [Topomyia yanbarensis]